MSILFLKKIWRTFILFVGPLMPLFWTSGDVSSGFQSQSGFCLIRTWRRRTSSITRSLRFTSGATPANLLAASMAAEPSLPHTCEGIGGSRTGDISLHERTLNRLSYAGAATSEHTYICERKWLNSESVSNRARVPKHSHQFSAADHHVRARSYKYSCALTRPVRTDKRLERLE